MVALSSQAADYTATVEFCEENGYKYVLYNSFGDCITALENGKTEFLILNEFEYNSLKLTENDVSFVEKTDYQKDFSAVFSRNNAALYNEFNNAVKLLKENGTFEKVKEAYFKGERADVTPSREYQGQLDVLLSPVFENRVFYTEEGELAGLDVYLAEAILTYLGYTPNFIDCEFEDMFFNIDNGEGDLIFSAIEYTDQRAQNYLLTESYYTEEYFVYTRTQQ